MANTVVTKEQFRWVLLEVLIQVLLYMFASLGNGASRSKHFSKEYMNQFEAEMAAYGKKVPQGGVPDCDG